MRRHGHDPIRERRINQSVRISQNQPEEEQIKRKSEEEMNSDRKVIGATVDGKKQIGEYGEVQKRYLEELSLYHKQIKKIRKLFGGNRAA
jgi:hypothetical protein